jgi:DnaJ-class molecular chaperone
MSMVECPLCEGVGGGENVTADGIWYTWGVCPDCDGSGLVPYVAAKSESPEMCDACGLAVSDPVHRGWGPCAKEGAGR